jgi:hypothetical protein
LRHIRSQMPFSDTKETSEITTANSWIRASFGQTYLTKDTQYLGKRSCLNICNLLKIFLLSHSFLIFWSHFLSLYVLYASV